MPLIPITAIEDERVAVYRDLPRGERMRGAELFIAEGHLLVERLLASNCRMHSLLVEEPRLQQLPHVPDEIRVYVTPSGLVEQIIGFNFHRGVLGCGYRPPPLSLDEAASRLKTSATAVACVGVQDPTNLGGILRNCAAFGADLVLVDARSAYAFSRRVLRVSMGASLKLPIVESADLQLDLRRLRDEQRFELAAAVLAADAEQLSGAARAPRMALLIGNEGYGLPPDYVALCDRRMTIPMSLGTDSLNAAVASGIFLYHFRRDVTA